MIEKTYLVGIIGGIGSGKSEVTRILRELGATVLVADEINAELLAGCDYINILSRHFPDAIDCGAINKSKLTEIIYNNEEKRQLLMSLSHPLIIKIMKSRTNGALCFYEIPLFNQIDIEFDSLWYVYASHEKRILRVMKRNKLSEESVKKIMISQGELDLSNKNVTIIDNDGEKSDLKNRVEDLYCQLQQKLPL